MCVGGMLCLVHTFVVLLFVIQTIEQGEEGVCGGASWEQGGGEGPGKVTSPKFRVGGGGGVTAEFK